MTTPTSEELLKNCPFCGSEGELLDIRAALPFVVQCRNRHKTCAINMRTHHYAKREEAIAAWNTRPSEAEPVAADAYEFRTAHNNNWRQWCKCTQKIHDEIAATGKYRSVSGQLMKADSRKLYLHPAHPSLLAMRDALVEARAWVQALKDMGASYYSIDDLNASLAQIDAALAAGSAWQPIETTPKDGTAAMIEAFQLAAKWHEEQTRQLSSFTRSVASQYKINTHNDAIQHFLALIAELEKTMTQDYLPSGEE